MVLDYDYGINIGNRFGDLIDHDEDPEEFIANQTQPETKTKKSTTSTKDTKSASASASTKKPTSKTAAPNTGAVNVSSSSTTRTNKENVTGKSTNTDQRRQQSNVLGDNNTNTAPQTRGDSARGGGRTFSRRGGGGAGHDRPAYEGGNRGGGGGGGGGQYRSQRFNKFEGQQAPHETSGFEQGGDAWGNEAGNDNQTFGGGRGRGGRGRGNYGNRNFEGGRGGGRGRGGRGRGNYGNRSFEEGSHQQHTQETSNWQESTDSNFGNTQAQPVQTADGEFDVDVAPQERPIEPDTSRRGGGRGGYYDRTFRNQRGYGRDRYEHEGGHGESRQMRRQHDRQPRSYVSGVKPIEKKDGEGAHNWGNPTEIPDEQPVVDETNETEPAQTAPTSKGWAEQVDEAEKQMTLDEYKKQQEEKRRAQLEKLPHFNRREAGEGEDPKSWQNFQHEYRKKTDDDEGEDEGEEGSEDEEHESDEEGEEEHQTGKKRIINIPLRFKPIDVPRGGPMGSRGGPRRGGGGGGGRYHDRPYRDDRPPRDDQARPKSPSQQQAPSSQQTGDYPNDEQQQHQQQQSYQRPYRGGGRPRGQGYGPMEFRRGYGNSGRGSRGGGGYNRSQPETNTPDIGNPEDFPTLLKQ